MGKLEIKTDWCKSCSICIDVCPRKVLAIGDRINSQGYNYVVFTDDGTCTGCAICAEICPDVLIEVYR